MLVWYADGLVERRTEDLDVGLRRLARLPAGCGTGTAAGVRDHLIATLARDRPLADDVAVLCLHLP
jgi:hypothetical protein